MSDEQVPVRRPLEPRLLLAELAIPFRGAGEAGRLWLAGSRVIVRWAARCCCKQVVRAVKWVAGGSELPERAERAALILGALAVPVVVGASLLGGIWGQYGHAIGAFAPVGISAAGAGWTVVAWLLAPPRRYSAPQNDHEKLVGEKTQDAIPVTTEQQQDLLRQYVERAAAAAHRQGQPGVHLDTLLAGLQKHGYRIQAAADFRPLLEAAGIPVKSVNIRSQKGQRNRLGVRYDQLAQTLARAALPTPVMGADGTPAEGPQQAPTEGDPDPDEAPR